MSCIHVHHPGITNLSGMGRAAQGGPRERESLHRTRSLAWNGLFYLWFWGWGPKLVLWEAEDGTRWGPSPKIGLRFALGGLVMCALGPGPGPPEARKSIGTPRPNQSENSIPQNK